LSIRLSYSIQLTGIRFDPMRTRGVIRICLLMAAVLAHPAVADARQSQAGGYGPEVRSFLGLMDDEEKELEFQIRNNEISRKGYVRAKTKIAILRQTVLKIVGETGQDLVPELHVVASSEVDQLIEDGSTLIKRARAGEVIAEKWLYRGSVTRGELFYVFERLPKQ
jgi:hypothetical protein